MTCLFTTSWDDGHPLDLRVAALLSELGFKGTFYVPIRNVEGRPVLSPEQVRSVGVSHEIGCHSIDHIPLVRLTAAELRHQVNGSKLQLEQILGREIQGFCYPRGIYNRAIRNEVRRAGFTYARTVENLWLAPRRDPLVLPTTLQLYPHRRATFARNFASGRAWKLRLGALARVMRSSNLDVILDALLEEAVEHSGMFHLWGHSWEIDEQGLWGTLERFLRRAARLVPPSRRVDNAALVAEIGGCS